MASSVAIGTKLGRYVVVKHLARGGMADLVLARAGGIGGFERHVVIKQILPAQADDATFVDMFMTEARLAATLHHNNIVQVHEIGQQDGRHYFAMEYVHGQDLRKVLAHLARRNEQIPIQHVVTIGSAAAAALHHAHEQKAPDRTPLDIVHRDVTPANILVSYDGHVKVADFGIAKAAMTSVTQAGMLKGKVSYMSPEQCAGGKIDRRSDVFGLGIVLYELATTRRLFKGENEWYTMSAIVNGNVPSPAVHRTDLPKPLEQIILKALARSPADRYQTAEALGLALDGFANAARLPTSTGALAAFMKAQFGEPVEPWLADRGPDIELTIDFDGGGTGVAAPPVEMIEGFTIPKSVHATDTSPLFLARTRMIKQPVTPKPPTLPTRSIKKPVELESAKPKAAPSDDTGTTNLVVAKRADDSNATKPIVPSSDKQPRPATDTELSVTPSITTTITQDTGSDTVRDRATTDLDDPTEVSPRSVPPPFNASQVQRNTPTAIVVPLPAPRTTSPAAPPKPPSPPTEIVKPLAPPSSVLSEIPAEEIEARPARRWPRQHLLIAAGAGVALASAITLMIAMTGRDVTIAPVAEGGALRPATVASPEPPPVSPPQATPPTAIAPIPEPAPPIAASPTVDPPAELPTPPPSSPSIKLAPPSPSAKPIKVAVKTSKPTTKSAPRAAKLPSKSANAAKVESVAKPPKLAAKSTPTPEVAKPVDSAVQMKSDPGEPDKKPGTWDPNRLFPTKKRSP